MAVSNEFQTRITDLVAESDHKRSDLPKLIGIDYSSLSNALNYGIIPTPRINQNCGLLQHLTCLPSWLVG